MKHSTQGILPYFTHQHGLLKLEPVSSFSYKNQVNMVIWALSP